VRLAIDGPFSRSPLAGTIAQASDSAFAFARPGSDALADDVSLTLPPNLFDGIELASIRATLPGGAPLPGWLLFDELHRTLHGHLPPGVPPGITVEVIGIDVKGKQHRATFKLGAAAQVRDDGARAQLPARLAGSDLLAALGLTGAPHGTRAASADSQAPVHARHLSDQLTRTAQRFTQDSGATLRHLEQIDQQAATGEPA
jgi:hypothetical protein